MHIGIDIDIDIYTIYVHTYSNFCQTKADIYIYKVLKNLSDTVYKVSKILQHSREISRNYYHLNLKLSKCTVVA